MTVSAKTKISQGKMINLTFDQILMIFKENFAAFRRKNKKVYEVRQHQAIHEDTLAVSVTIHSK